MAGFGVPKAVGTGRRRSHGSHHHTVPADHHDHDITYEQRHDRPCGLLPSFSLSFLSSVVVVVAVVVVPSC
jgi:hypothetical protein